MMRNIFIKVRKQKKRSNMGKLCNKKYQPLGTDDQMQYIYNPKCIHKR